MGAVQAKPKINWYRSPVDRETLAELNRRSDRQGLLQTGGHLGLLVLTGAAAWYAVGRLAWPLVLLLLFVHGTGYAFLLNGFHELCHKTVFKTKSLNTFSCPSSASWAGTTRSSSGPAIRSTTSTRCTRRTISKWCCRSS